MANSCGNVIYAAKGRGTKAVKIEKQADGFVAKELWSNPELGVQFNTQVLKDGLLFGLSDGGNLFCINAQTGQTAWTDTVQRDRGGFAAILDAGSVLLALPSNSELIVLKPDGKGHSEISRYKVAETPSYAHPIISGNRVFIKDQESVTMFRI
ncbi:MAG: PQQ-binding-like beta-propeller repeat protein [Planctomycetota bacterium]|jgi:outer membrane protein assembly factor BamB